jgi:hypothetical protein
MRAILLLIMLEAVATAAPRGTVLHIGERAIYVDRGTADGVDRGKKLVLFHAIEAVHPVSGAKVRDTFPLGELTVVRAAEHLALCTAPDEIMGRVAVADEIELPPGAAPIPDPWAVQVEKRAAAARAAAADPEVMRRERARAAADADVAAENAASETWDATLGQPPERRVALWLDYLKRYPDSSLAGAVQAEIDRLRAEQKAEGQLALDAARRRTARGAGGALPPYQRTPDVRLAGPLAYVPPARATEGESVELAFLTPKAGAVRAAWLHYRTAGDTTYRRAALVAAGDGALRAVIPAETVRVPSVQYFVEVLDAGADAPRAVAGRGEAPLAFVVETRPAEPPPDVTGRSRVTLIFDWVNFDDRTGQDHYVQAEADFQYRFRSPIWSMRLGIAALNGVGGPTEVIDSAYNMGRAACTDASGNYRCTHVDFNYVYTELEFRLSDTIAFMVRPLFGRGHHDTSPNDDHHDFRDSLGARLRLRLGRETETNLAIGAALTDGFGQLYEAVFTWNVIPRFPVVLSAQVTDQPVPGDFGVRIIADVGWRGLRWVYPSVRVSYQARNIDHGGVSAGGAINFDW